MLAGPPVDLSAYEGQPLSRDVLRGATDRDHGRHHRPARAAARQAAPGRAVRPGRRPPRQAAADGQAKAGAQAEPGAPAGARRTGGAQRADGAPRATARPGRRRRREGGGHGRRHVGHHLRAGALRRRHAGRRSGAAGRSWPRRSTSGTRTPVYLPGHHADQRAARDHATRRRRWTAPTWSCWPCPPRRCAGNLAGWAGLLPPDALLVSLMKGIELGTHQRMSEVIAEVTGAGPDRIAVISGPNLAREIAAAPVRRHRGRLRRRRHGQARCRRPATPPYFRPYTNPDVIGCELGGAVKNVIALAVGHRGRHGPRATTPGPR